MPSRVSTEVNQGKNVGTIYSEREEIIMKCKKCGSHYKLGWTGTKDGCDKCAGVDRDINGEVWYRGEKTQERMDVETEEAFTLYRESVFPPYTNIVVK
jgi:hypothetical protein